MYKTFAHGRTDGQTFFEKVLFFPPDQEYIYMSIPISIIFQIALPCDQSQYTFFSILEMGMKITDDYLYETRNDELN